MITQLENYQLEIRSSLENINQVEQLLDTVREELNIRDDIYGNMMVAITEAVNNAIIHGNASDPEKKVKVSVAKENDHVIIFYVKDEGKGFEFNNLPDPTAPENLEKPTGRGVFLMTNLSDLVVFSDNGSLVEIQFKL
jgi:anti-sigma regulatory factor (Ser/Thr protein kinase)